MLSKRKPQKASKHGSNYRFNFRVCRSGCWRHLLLHSRPQTINLAPGARPFPLHARFCTRWDFFVLYGVVSFPLCSLFTRSVVHLSSFFLLVPYRSITFRFLPNSFTMVLSLWGQCCPLYPLLSAKHRSSFHQKKSWHPAWRFRFFYVDLPQANRQRKTHTSTFNHFMAQKCCV